MGAYPQHLYPKYGSRFMPHISAFQFSEFLSRQSGAAADQPLLLSHALNRSPVGDDACRADSARRSRTKAEVRRRRVRRLKFKTPNGVSEGSPGLRGTSYPGIPSPKYISPSPQRRRGERSSLVSGLSTLNSQTISPRAILPRQ